MKLKKSKIRSRLGKTNPFAEIFTDVSNKIETDAYFNDTTDVVFSAGKACYKGKTENATYEDKLRFVDARVKVDHESIIEHTNFLVALKVPYKYYESLIELLSCCHYLYVRTEVTHEKINKINADRMLVNIGGSIRGYKEIYRSIPDLNNIILKHITHLIYQNIPKEYFTDFINDGLFVESNFCTIEENKDIKYPKDKLNFCIPDDTERKIQFIHIDTISDLISRGFPIKNRVEWYRDLLNVTVKFNGLARYSTQHLVRHRNAVTQESQRYVDYSDMPINNPMIYNPEYDPNKQYHIPPTDLVKFKDGITSDELCQALQNIYKCLKNGGMKPEEARGFAAFATRTGDLYMTFTYRTLAKFLQLRLDSHAQGEIRHWAEILHEYIQHIPELKKLIDTNDETPTLSNLLIKPAYRLIGESEDNDSYYEDIDEVIE